MAARIPFTPTSYLVLGLVSSMEPVTAYEMKQRVSVSIGYFWPFPHSQLYAEPARLCEAGYLEDDVEPEGRKRRRYTITDAGRRALRRWLADPTTQHTEVRDLGLLKLYFIAHASDDDRRRLATLQLAAHQSRQQEYETLERAVRGVAGPWELKTLDMGLRFERAMVAFWSELTD